MGVHTDFRGFESPPAGLDADLTDLGNSTLIVDGTAYSGLRYLRNVVTVPIEATGVRYPASTLSVPSNGGGFDYLMEIYFRCKTHPSGNDVHVAGCLLNCQLEMDTAGHLRLRGPNSINLSAYSVQTIPEDLLIWYRLVLRHYGVTLTAGKTNSRRSRATADIYLASSGAHLFSVVSAPQAGTGCTSGGTNFSGSCSAGSGGLTPWNVETMTGNTSFQTMATVGLDHISVAYVGGGDSYAPGVAGDYSVFASETVANSSGFSNCFRGNTGGTYTYIEHGMLQPFNEDFSLFFIDNAPTSDTFVLGSDGSGPSATRWFEYDAVTVTSTTYDIIGDISYSATAAFDAGTGNMTVGGGTDIAMNARAAFTPGYPGIPLNISASWELQRFDAKVRDEERS